MNIDEKDFLEYIVKNIVSNPEEVKVEKETDDRGIKLTLNVSSKDGDMGKIIGSQGRMATSIRTVMHAFGGKYDKKVSVIINDPTKE